MKVIFFESLFLNGHYIENFFDNSYPQKQHLSRFFLSGRNFLDFQILSKFTYGPSKGPRVCLNLVDTIEVAENLQEIKFFFV